MANKKPLVTIIITEQVAHISSVYVPCIAAALRAQFVKVVADSDVGVVLRRDTRSFLTAVGGKASATFPSGLLHRVRSALVSEGHPTRLVDQSSWNDLHQHARTMEKSIYCPRAAPEFQFPGVELDWENLARQWSSPGRKHLRYFACRPRGHFQVTNWGEAAEIVRACAHVHALLPIEVIVKNNTLARELYQKLRPTLGGRVTLFPNLPTGEAATIGNRVEVVTSHHATGPNLDFLPILFFIGHETATSQQGYLDAMQRKQGHLRFVIRNAAALLTDLEQMQLEAVAGPVVYTQGRYSPAPRRLEVISAAASVSPAGSGRHVVGPELAELVNAMARALRAARPERLVKLGMPERLAQNLIGERNCPLRVAILVETMCEANLLAEKIQAAHVLTYAKAAALRPGPYHGRWTIIATELLAEQVAIAADVFICATRGREGLARSLTHAASEGKPVKWVIDVIPGSPEGGSNSGSIWWRGIYRAQLRLPADDIEDDSEREEIE